MKGPFKIYADKIPITVPIEDDKRAVLAYSMLYSMAERVIMFEAGKKTDGQQRLTTDQLSVIDADGKSFKPKLDAEWYGTDEQKESIRQLTVEINHAERRSIEMEVREESLMNDEDPGPLSDVENVDVGEELMDKYSVYAYNDIDDSVQFMPNTWSFDKANEMINFIQYGLDPSVSLYSIQNDEAVKISGSNINLICISVFDEEQWMADDEKDWAKNPMNENVVSLMEIQEFADAVLTIPDGGRGMEQ